MGRHVHLSYFRLNTPKNRPPLLPLWVIGALRAGGSGKTGVTIALANELSDRGFKVAVMVYWLFKRRNREEHILFKGQPWYDVSDEAVLISEKTPCDVYATRNRLRLWKALERKNLYDVILSDDGFQDTRLIQATHLVLAHPRRKISFWKLLPGGPFRETHSALRRAHWVLPVRDSQAPAANFGVKEAFPAIHRVPVVGRAKLLEKGVILICALGHNGRLRKSCEGLGIRVLHFVPLKDHTLISDRKLRAIIRKYPGTPVLTTEKDFVKMRGMAFLPEALICLGEKVYFPQAVLETLIFQSGLGDRPIFLPKFAFSG